MPDERDEKHLDEYLEGDSEVSRLYRLGAAEEPDPALDDAILARARRAVGSRPRVVHSPFARHWMVPTSLAAVLVISVSAVLLVPGPETTPEAPFERGLEAPAADVTEHWRDAESAPAGLREAEPASRPDADDAGRAPETRAGDAPPARKRAAGAAGKAVLQRGEFAAEEQATPTAEPAPATGAASGVAPAPPGAGAVRAPEGTVRDDPARWVRLIETLVATREEERARQSLREFLVRYPDYPLPESLRALAQSLEAPTR